MTLKILGFKNSQAQHLSNQQLPFKNEILHVRRLVVFSFILWHVNEIWRKQSSNTGNSEITPQSCHPICILRTSMQICPAVAWTAGKRRETAGTSPRNPTGCLHALSWKWMYNSKQRTKTFRWFSKSSGKAENVRMMGWIHSRYRLTSTCCDWSACLAACTVYSQTPSWPPSTLPTVCCPWLAVCLLRYMFVSFQSLSQPAYSEAESSALWLVSFPVPHMSPACMCFKSDSGSSSSLGDVLEWILLISSRALARESRSAVSWWRASQRLSITADGLCCFAK